MMKVIAAIVQPRAAQHTVRFLAGSGAEPVNDCGPREWRFNLSFSLSPLLFFVLRIKADQYDITAWESLIAETAKVNRLPCLNPPLATI